MVTLTGEIRYVVCVHTHTHIYKVTGRQKVYTMAYDNLKSLQFLINYNNNNKVCKTNQMKKISDFVKKVQAGWQAWIEVSGCVVYTYPTLEWWLTFNGSGETAVWQCKTYCIIIATALADNW